jgi:hypothetical protein
MTTSPKKAKYGTKPRAQTKKGRTPRARTQTEKGKYNTHNQKHTPKRIADGSESEESSEEEMRQPRKKRSKLTVQSNVEEKGSEVSNSDDIVEVTSGNESKSDFQVSIRHHSLLQHTVLLITYL